MNRSKKMTTRGRQGGNKKSEKSEAFFIKSLLATYVDLPHLATPQPKSRSQPRTTCFFDGRNSQPQAQLYYIDVPNLEF